MDLIISSEYHQYETVNIETLKNMLIIFTLCFMWYLHNRQIQSLKTYTDSNISVILKKINKINKNQDEIFIILKDIDLFINNVDITIKPDDYMTTTKEEDEDDKEDEHEDDKEDEDEDEDEDEHEEDDDPSSDYEP